MSKPKFRFPVASSKFKKGRRTRKAKGYCVEVAITKRGVAVRDSKDKQGPRLYYTRDEWKAFIGSVKDGDFRLR